MSETAPRNRSLVSRGPGPGDGTVGLDADYGTAGLDADYETTGLGADSTRPTRHTDGFFIAN